MPGNAFNPDGTYTREQTYLTLLRLYNAGVDTSKNNLPEPEYYRYGDGYIDSFGNPYTKDQQGYVYPFDQQYKVVIDNVSAGANYSHIIDKTGKTLLEDFDGLTGNGIRNVTVYGNIATFLGISHMYAVNLKTGAIYENVFLDPPSDDMIRFYKGEKVGYIDMEGNLAIGPQYKDAGNFYNRKAVVELQDGSWNLIDTTGKTIKQNILKSLKGTVSNIYTNYGENLILQDSKEKYAIYNVNANLLTGFNYDMELSKREVYWHTGRFFNAFRQKRKTGFKSICT